MQENKNYLRLLPRVTRLTIEIYHLYHARCCYGKSLGNDTDKDMRLAHRIVTEKEKIFGLLRFSALRREVRIVDEVGNVNEQIKERTYDLKSKEQGCMIQVSVPASAGEKNFEYNAEVELINPVVDTVALLLHSKGLIWITTSK